MGRFRALVFGGVILSQWKTAQSEEKADSSATASPVCRNAPPEASWNPPSSMGLMPYTWEGRN